MDRLSDLQKAVTKDIQRASKDKQDLITTFDNAVRAAQRARKRDDQLGSNSDMAPGKGTR